MIDHIGCELIQQLNWMNFYNYNVKSWMLPQRKCLMEFIAKFHLSAFSKLWNIESCLFPKIGIVERRFEIFECSNLEKANEWSQKLQILTPFPPNSLETTLFTRNNFKPILWIKDSKPCILFTGVLMSFHHKLPRQSTFSLERKLVFS